MNTKVTTYRSVSWNCLTKTYWRSNRCTTHALCGETLKPRLKTLLRRIINALKARVKVVLILNNSFAQIVIPKISEMKRFENLYGVIIFTYDDKKAQFLNIWCDKYRKVYHDINIAVTTSFENVINIAEKIISKSNLALKTKVDQKEIK